MKSSLPSENQRDFKRKTRKSSSSSTFPKPSVVAIVLQCFSVFLLLIRFTMGFQRTSSSLQVYISRTRQQRRFRLSSIQRHLSVDKNTESHLLPRIYVGPTQDAALQLDQFIKNCQQQHQQLQPSSSLLRPDGILELSPGQTNYVANVMRMVGPGRKKGRWRFQHFDPCVRVFDEVQEWVAHLEAMDDFSSDNGGGKAQKRRRKNMESMSVVAKCIAPITTSDPKVQPQQSTTTLVPLLAFAPPKKKDRFQWILEKSTELGMAGWMLLQTDRAEASSSRDYWRKGQAYALEAAEQCERLQIPPVVLHSPSGEDAANAGDGLDDDPNNLNSSPVLSKVTEVLEFVSNNENFVNKASVLICRERSDESTPILKALKQIEKESDALSFCCIVLVGPEGGWSSEEEALFDAYQNRKNIWNVSLGNSVLRTDTAAVTAMSAFSLYDHDL